MISGTTGAVEWQLGGKQSTFTLGSGRALRLAARRPAPAERHDQAVRQRGGPRRRPNREPSISRSTRRAHTASLVSQFTYPGAGILAESQGNMQELPNGDDFVGWGQAGEASEFSPAAR